MSGAPGRLDIGWISKGEENGRFLLSLTNLCEIPLSGFRLVYTSLADIPQGVDMINIFRKPNALDAIADAAIARGDVKVFWSQIGIVNNAAAQKAEDAGMAVVQNRCSMVEHRKLIG